MSAPGSKRAGVGEATERLALHSTLGLPLLKVPQRDSPSGVLHPLDHLEQGVRRSKEEQEEQGGAGGPGRKGGAGGGSRMLT